MVKQENTKATVAEEAEEAEEAAVNLAISLAKILNQKIKIKKIISEIGIQKM